MFSNSVSEKVGKPLPHEKPWDHATVIESLTEGTDNLFCISGALHKGELTHLDVVTLGRGRSLHCARDQILLIQKLVGKASAI